MFRPPDRRVLVVIPTLNEALHIGEVIGQLQRDLPAHADVLFVVADGGSTDGTSLIVQRLARERPGLRLMHNPARLQSAAVNRAAQRFGGDRDILIRCDAHAGYPAGYIAQLVDSLERHAADAVVVPMDSHGETCVQRAIAWLSDSPLGSGGSAHRGGRGSGFVDHGHHAAFRMESFLRAGGYDESFSHNEDAELDCRQRAHGSRIYLDASIRIRYMPRRTLGALAAQYRAYGRGRSRTMRRHPDSWRARQLAVPGHVLLCLLALAAAPAWPLSLGYPLAYLGGLGLGALALWRRHGDACALMAAPAALVMHLAWSFGFVEGLVTLRERRWQRDAVSTEGHSIA